MDSGRIVFTDHTINNTTFAGDVYRNDVPVDVKLVVGLRCPTTILTIALLDRDPVLNGHGGVHLE